MQNPMAATSAWPMAFFPPHLAGLPLGILPHSSTSSKPRVGLGVICRCVPHSYNVECLLLKRGPKFVSPLKWSFPGGRLDEDGEGDDDGERCTLRELKKECGGGNPGGLPPLIHIESYKAGKTLYHVFVIDCEAQPAWLNWQPSITVEHTGEIDQSAGDLVLQGNRYPSSNGFCWADLQTLIEECMLISNPDQDMASITDLQHGLVRWVKSNGENILKMLMARSPKLERHRRYPSSGGSTPGGGAKGSQGRPRSGSGGSRNRRQHPQESHLFSTPTPIIPGQQVFRPSDHYGNLGGPPLMQVMPGTLPPEFLKHIQQGTGDPAGSQIPHMGVDHAHSYQTPPGGIVHMQMGGAVDTPIQSSQHSPIKNIGNDDKQGVGGAFGMYDGNTDNDTPLHQVPYNSSGLLVTPPESSLYDSNYHQQLHHALIQNHAYQVGMENHAHQHDQSRYYANHHRRSDVCRNYLQGHCMYGEKCWFVHPDQKPNREPLLGPGGIFNAPVVPQHGVFPVGMEQYLAQQFSPKSPSGVRGNTPGATPTPWRVPGVVNRHSFPFMQRGVFVGGAQQQVLLRPLMYPPNHFGSPHNDQMVLPIPDPVLRFRLLSDSTVKDSNEDPLTDVTSLCVRADHFFLTHKQSLQDYRILFGSDRAHDNHHLTGEQLFSNRVTCTHVSKISSSLLLVGTEGEGVYTFDTKRNGPVNPLMTVHEPQSDATAITTLVHFNTVAAAQVVVTGNDKGAVTWHIAQPPMKTFTVLASQTAHMPHPVVCLQILGGCLVSGSSNGLVCLWNMRAQEPILVDSFQAHSESLLNIHVLDTSCFITVGINKENFPAPSLPPTNELQEVPTDETTPTEIKQEDLKSDVDDVDNLAGRLDDVSLNTVAPNCSIALWEYGKPIKMFKTIDSPGPITCTAFYQHPLLGNRFLAVGLMGGAVKIYSLPSFTVASEIHFQDIADKNCSHIALNLSREREYTQNFNVKNPFRDLILTTVWSDGKIMICLLDSRKNV